MSTDQLFEAAPSPHVPDEIKLAYNALAEKMQGQFFSYIQIRRPGSTSIWTTTEYARVGDLEQSVEHHTRSAVRSIERHTHTGSKHTARTAAEHIFRARCYRELYHEKMGTVCTEADMPFPIPVDHDAH